MSRFFDELEERLRSSTVEQHAREARDVPSPRPRRRRWIRRRPLVAVAIAAAGLAVPAVAAVTDVWRPDVEPRQPRPPVRTVMNDRPRTVRSDRAHAFSCRQVAPSRIDVGPPIGREFTSVLSILGRHRTSADAFDRRQLQPLLIGVDVAAIRYVGTAADGARTFVIPARGMRMMPPHCLGQLRPQDRKRVLSAERRQPMICMQGGGGTCATLADFRRHGTFGTSGAARGRATASGVVPDGVRAVRITYGSSTREFPVADNFFSFQVALDVEAGLPDRLEWLMEDGSVRDATAGSAAPRVDRSR
jgi:hypothetical protein